MYDEVKDLLLSLVRCALNNECLTDEVKTGIRPEVLERVIKLSAMHKIVPMVSDVLFRNGVLKNGAGIGAEVRKAQIRAIYRYESMQHELDRIYELFEQGEIEFVPLKGSVVRELYPEPWMRTSCDIDILVKEEQLIKAQTFLTEKLDYTRVTATFHDVSYDSPSKVRLELHFDLVEEKVNKKMAEALDSVWENVYPVGNGGRKQMSSEMFILYHIAHMAKHMLSGGCGIRMFIDLHLMRGALEVEKKKLDGLLKKASLKSFAAACDKLCDVWFSGAEHTELTQKLEEFIIKGGVFGTTDNKAAIMTVRGKSRLGDCFRAVFLPRANLEAIYPNLSKHPWLLPFYQVKRWFKVLDPSKRRLLKRELASDAKVDSKKTADISELMSELELIN